MAADDHAVVVGIRTYPAIRPLKGPCRDAEAFLAWLRNPAKGDVPEDQISHLVTEDFPNPDSTEHPLADEIHGLFRPLVEKGHLAVSNDEKLGRRLYIFMAGHGFSQRGDETSAALLAANAAPSFSVNVAATDYARWFKYNALFDEIVLLLDCCRTTSSFNSITPLPVPQTRGSDRRNRVGTFFGYAVADGQPAREKECDGRWNGIFTSALLDALEHALPNRAGLVRGRELADYIHTRLSDVQPPELVVNDRRDVIFAERLDGAAMNVWFRLDPFVPGSEVVILDHNRSELSRLSPGADRFKQGLAAGLYKAILEGSGRKALFEVPTNDEVVL